MPVPALQTTGLLLQSAGQRPAAHALCRLRGRPTHPSDRRPSFLGSSPAAAGGCRSSKHWPPSCPLSPRPPCWPPLHALLLPPLPPPLAFRRRPPPPHPTHLIRVPLAPAPSLLPSLCRWYEEVVAAREDITRLMTLESGKPLGESRGEFDNG